MDCPNKCAYCQLIIDSDDFLNCINCKENVHTKCLLRPGTPGDLQGDVFFIFTCVKCTNNAKEHFTRRQDLSWFMVVTLAMYNLSIRCAGLSRQGYFHYRTHICQFIAKNWTYLFNPSHNIYRQRKKKWQGTVAGVLSLHKNYFISGYETFRESGWWKLAYNQTPKFYSKLYEQMNRLQLRNDKRNAEESCSSDFSNAPSDEVSFKRRRRDMNTRAETTINIISDDNSPLLRRRTQKEEMKEEKQCSRTRPYMGRKTEDAEIKVEVSEDSADINSTQSHLMDFLAESLSCDDLFSNDLPSIDTKDFLPLISNEQDQNASELWNPDTTNLDYEDAKLFNPLEVPPGNDSSEEEEKYAPRIVQITNFQKMQNNEKDLVVDNNYTIKEEPQSEMEEEENDDYVCENSLFIKIPRRELPWKEETDGSQLIAPESFKNYDSSRLQLMSEYEEKGLYRQLKDIINSEKYINVEIPASVRRLYRKLCIRNIKRNSSQRIFNIDTFGEKKFLKSNKMEVLDRYYHLTSGVNLKEESTFHARITGSVYDELFESPYTSRILHPYIYRHSKFFPPWLKLMCELQYSVNCVVPSRSTIDFTYVRPHHMAAVNGLLQKMFWPGIDMSECLSYPDFSIIALYKKLVIGCAFLVPDVGYNEAYISFMAVRPGWQRSGIASFMLYHLTQTCMGKDITLHVSANNPAICLYQKFGFKIEEVILDFYEKYFPIESTQSRHAFLLRLKR